MAHGVEASGPDLSRGVAPGSIPEGGTLAGHVGGQPVLVSRIDGEFHAVGGVCTHYGAPLAEGLIVDGRAHCPWHHACFDLRSGEAVKAPAFDPLGRWRVERDGDRLYVRERLEEPAPRDGGGKDKAIVIIGGGAAGFAAAEGLRRRGFGGSVTMLTEEPNAPCDRPNLSKDYLAGTAPEEWVYMKPEEWFGEQGIALRMGDPAVRIDPGKRLVHCASGASHAFDALLIATGADPVRLKTPGFERPDVMVLRSLADARQIIAAAGQAKSAAVIGASFIGLEAAAALATRGLEVHVVAPDAVPMEKVMGREIGEYVRALHERHGVRFHLGRTASRFDGTMLALDNGEEIAVGLVVQGVGVRPRASLAEACGIAVDNGILVDRFLETSIPGIFAAGDVANVGDEGNRARIEHWVVAERQGQAVAGSLVGEREPYADVPFFWSRHFDSSIHYVGHAAAWDSLEIDGSVADGDCSVRFLEQGQSRALATIGRSDESLAEEARLAGVMAPA